MLLVKLGGQDVTGATFDSVMEALVAAPAGVPIDLVFRDPSVPSPAPPPPPPPPPIAACEIRVMSADGQKEVGVVKAKTGDNLRKALLAGKVEVYDMVGKVCHLGVLRLVHVCRYTVVYCFVLYYVSTYVGKVFCRL